ncbi:hypothetical protein C7434_3781 [Pantoea sp. PNA 14-12]|uniref:plasmid IncI1-type surface exclusion protein ExcA n=1 Tax=Pantoea TaxID=53335 RepID=UPI00105EF0EE|nr:MULTISPECIES: plasmid IncI1-type surface exclusion protein ExcA [Pantoea]TDS68035.1 hypothetical protein C7434_3781 [Pantoea sp. PNA 14-12]
MNKAESVKSDKEALGKRLFSIYMMTCLPCALLATISSVFITPSLFRKGDYLTLSLFVIIWAAVVGPVISAGLSKYRCRKALDKMVALLRCPNLFNPRTHQVVDTRRGLYFGVDNEHGTLLYIRRVSKYTTDVVALTMDDWVKCEQKNGCLRIHTCVSDLPMLCVYDHPASVRLMAETLKAMRYRSYPELLGEAWPHYVRGQSRIIPYEHNVIASNDI